MPWKCRLPTNVQKRDLFHLVFTKDYSNSWYALQMRRAAHDIIESMQLRWASDEVTEYTVLHQWTPPTGKQAVAAQRIDFTPDSTPVAVNPSMKFGSTQCKNGFSLSSLKFHEVGSTTLFVNARPGTDVESFTVVFELIYLVTTFYVGD